MTFLRLLTVGLWYFVKRNRWQFLVIFALVGISGLGLYQSALDNLGADKLWWSGMWQNFGTEVIGAILTFTIFEMLINANIRQEELIRQMASSDNATALNAVNELRELGYLFDGTLRGKSLVSANLAGANLSKISLSKVKLISTDLSNADLHNVHISKSDLIDVNLSGANLQNAKLVNVNFVGVNLAGVNLFHADLLGCDFSFAQFSIKTLLPDGTWWKPTTDITYYTKLEYKNRKISIDDILKPRSYERKLIRPTPHPYRALRAKRRLRRTS